MVASLNGADGICGDSKIAKHTAHVTAAATDCPKQQTRNLQVKYQPLNCIISVSCQPLHFQASHISDATPIQIDSEGGS